MLKRALSGLLLLLSQGIAAVGGQEVLQASEDYGLVDLAAMTVTETNESLKEEIGEPAAAELNGDLAKRYSRDMLLQAVTAGLDAKGKPEHLAKLKAFFTSPLYRKVLAGEKYTETEAGEKGMEAFVEGLDEARYKKRIDLVNDMIINGKVAERMLDLFDACHEVQYKLAGVKDAQGKVKAIRKASARQWQMYLTTHILYAYKDLTDQELGAYAKQLKSPESRWYYDTILESLAGSIRKKA